jgi:hypothetical protein
MIHDMLILIEITKTNQVRGLRYQCNDSQVVALVLYSLLILVNQSSLNFAKMWQILKMYICFKT